MIELHPENLTNFRDMDEELHKQISSNCSPLLVNQGCTFLLFVMHSSLKIFI